MQTPSHRSDRGPAERRAATREAVLVALVATGLFGLLFQERLFGDGPLLLLSYRRDLATGHGLHYHVVSLLQALGLSLQAAARAASAVPAGLAVGLLHLTLLQAGYRRATARLGALALVLTPSAFFFATTIEVHGLQLLGCCLAMFGAMWMLAPGHSTAGRCLAFVLAALALAGTHPMNAPAGLGLALLLVVGLRRAGVSWARVLLPSVGLALLALAAGLWATEHYAQRQGFGPGVLAATFAWPLGETAPGSEQPMVLHNLLEAVVRPVAWLWLPGLAGLGLMLQDRRRRALGVGLLAWLLPSVLLLAGPDFHERGAYFLVALPALVLGLAELHERALFGLAPRPGVGLLGLLALALSLNLGATWRSLRSYDSPPPAEGAAWIQGLKEASKGRGVVLAADIHQQDWARSWVGLQADNLRLFLALPPDQLEAQARTYTSWAAGVVGDGEPLWVAAEIIDLAPDLPPLGRAVEVLRQRFHFDVVNSGGFVGYKGSLLP